MFPLSREMQESMRPVLGVGPLRIGNRSPKPSRLPLGRSLQGVMTLDERTNLFSKQELAKGFSIAVGVCLLAIGIWSLVKHNSPSNGELSLEMCVTDNARHRYGDTERRSKFGLNYSIESMKLLSSRTRGIHVSCHEYK